jgi:predicted DNA-binding protein with PD1-like motif
MDGPFQANGKRGGKLMTATGIRVGEGALGRVVALHMDPGTDLLKGLQATIESQGLRSAVILSGAGSLRQAVLRNVGSIPGRFPVTDANRVFVAKDEAMELLSLTGNVALRDDGRVVVHGHMVISSGREHGLAYGGHLVEGTIVFSTVEIILAEITGMSLTRSLDPITHAAELSFS